MQSVQVQRAADIVRAEFPHKSVYGLMTLTLTLLALTVFGAYHFYTWQQRQDAEATARAHTQDQWNVSLSGKLEGLKATVEFGPRLLALEEGQARQTVVLEAIAKELGITEE